MISAPETRRSLGTRRFWNREDGHDRVSSDRQRKLPKVQRGRFPKVGDSLFNRFALRRRAGFWIERNETALFGRGKDRGEFHLLSRSKAVLIVSEEHS